MKPSERIVELSKTALNNTDMNGIDKNLSTCMVMVQSICDYLDEEYEKNQAIMNSDKTGQVGMV